MDESHAVAFTDKGLQFFSTRVETSPESTSQILLDENIRSISYNDQYAGVITDNGSGADLTHTVCAFISRMEALYLRLPSVISILGLT